MYHTNVRAIFLGEGKLRYFGYEINYYYRGKKMAKKKNFNNKGGAANAHNQANNNNSANRGKGGTVNAANRGRGANQNRGKIQNKNSYTAQAERREMYFLIPIIFALCFIPLIVTTHDYSTEFTSFEWFNNTEIDQIDSFEYAKGVAVILTGIVVAIIIAGSKFVETIKAANKKIVVPLGIFILMVFLSSIFSSYKKLAFAGGGYSQFQTCFVLISYALLCYYAYRYITDNKKINCILIWFTGSTFIMALIGFLQSVGANPLKWAFVQKLMTVFSKVNSVGFKEGYSSVIMTFNNPDYVGSYVALTLPIIFFAIFAKPFATKWANIAYKVVNVIIIAMMLKALVVSGSLTGLIALAGGFGVAVLALIGSFTKTILVKNNTGNTANNKLGTGKIAAIVAAVIIGCIVLFMGGVFGVVKSGKVDGIVGKLTAGLKDTRNVISIVTDTDVLHIELRNGNKCDLTVPASANGGYDYKMTKEDGTEIPLQWADDISGYKVADQTFNMLTITPAAFSIEGQTIEGFKVNDVPNQISWIFIRQNNKWMYYTPFGKVIDLKPIRRFGFKNTENIASRRGYIWSRTIPLMADYWFTGIGPNAFIIAFPNNDFVGSKRVGGSTTLVDKPHNVFLQIYIQTGGISAIAYAFLWAYYIVCALINLFKRKKMTSLMWINVGLMSAMVSFAVSGITNDSVIGSQVIYWVLLGLGFAINKVIEKNRMNGEEA